jgi:hypothetical protein
MADDEDGESLSEDSSLDCTSRCDEDDDDDDDDDDEEEEEEEKENEPFGAFEPEEEEGTDGEDAATDGTKPIDVVPSCILSSSDVSCDTFVTP